MLAKLLLLSNQNNLHLERHYLISFINFLYPMKNTILRLFTNRLSAFAQKVGVGKYTYDWLLNRETKTRYCATTKRSLVI